MTFLAVVEGDEGGWHADRDALTEAIRARWAEVETDSSHRSEVRSLIWSFETENGPGEAYLHEDGTCLYMDVWEEDAMWLVLAFRALTPAHLDLVFCDQGYTFDVRVPTGTTEVELMTLVNAAG
ncbi:hypothetical protein [Streptomyces thermolilacinus]|uniref:Uncharacterized protein n=1 Tax=Streptomyces thermolilacinus SPC6 TaxID=1306406 RepID=A0A1D3DR99_9ACTN|nr:hypothetical protein [Streptomyces thermolilacinus]OEJ94847.1 hypothetical protein J116_010495 [Streptomyces thermolilacinus SPC6]